MGYDLKGDGVAIYSCVIKMDESPKLVEAFVKTQGNEAAGGNGSSLPNRNLYVRTSKNEILDVIAQLQATIDPNAPIDPELLIRD